MSLTQRGARKIATRPAAKASAPAARWTRLSLDTAHRCPPEQAGGLDEQDDEDQAERNRPPAPHACEPARLRIEGGRPHGEPELRVAKEQVDAAGQADRDGEDADVLLGHDHTGYVPCADRKGPAGRERAKSRLPDP